MTIPVLFRGGGVVVVDKPGGVPVEADGPEALVKQLARQLAPAGGRAWPRVVHRLDTGTSGCLAVALDARAEARLKAAFATSAVEKEYLALMAGMVPPEGRYDTPYGHDPADRRRHTTRTRTPRRARLRFRRVEQLGEAALVRVRLETGRTHQIRVQFAEAGHPLLGDDTYGDDRARALAARSGLRRQALHSSRLSFPGAGGAGRVECEAPLPEDLRAAIERLRAGG